ncbi:UDP-glucosyltransferase [Halobacillus litoralis]|uniref:UDP-glucosyltransferase n=1 Tax=Halobacillus litoralis TaxID=45668 RepID=A0A845DYU6_9BACI|nr:macrolide family glycosyltransferase [Halobacillus litoralis]MYL21615.1 UDP-glucosyltransferase [Halobacillus litoralis]
MADILMINVPAEGHVNPSLGVAKAFVDRGDNVHYITTEKYKARLEGVGAHVYLHEDHLLIGGVDPASEEGIHFFMNVMLKTSLDILSITKQLAEEISFDFVYYDSFGAGELVRDYLEVPGFSSSASFLIPEDYRKRLPLHPENTGTLEYSDKNRQLLETMKQEYGVAPSSMLQFMNNQGGRTMVYTSAYFQPRLEEFGEENHFIGPSFPERKGAHDFPLHELKDEKVLYISIGTVLDQVEEFFNQCIDAFADFNGKVVIAAGTFADFNKIKSAPENFIIRSYVPQLEVLEYTHVFLTHGGMNSVNEAIDREVPMVVLPRDKDQPMVAARLEELHAGYPIFPNDVSKEALHRGVDQVVNDEAYLEGIRKIKESFDHCGGPQEALAVIDRYLKKSS